MPKVLASPSQPIEVSLARIGAIATLGVALLSAGVFFGARHFGETLSLAGASTKTTPVALRIGRYDLAIPENAIRFPEQRQSQAQAEVDLYLQWPDMTGFAKGSESVFHDPDAAHVLFLRLSSAEPARDEPATLSPSQVQDPAPAGLTRSSRPGLPGIASEEAVYRASPSRKPAYEVGCLGGKDAVMAADCLREVQIAPGLRLRYRFSHALLPDWDRIDRAVMAYVAEHRRS